MGKPTVTPRAVIARRQTKEADVAIRFPPYTLAVGSGEDGFLAALGMTKGRE